MRFINQQYYQVIKLNGTVVKNIHHLAHLVDSKYSLMLNNLLVVISYNSCSTFHG